MTQDDKVHKIIKLVTTLNPRLRRPAQIMRLRHSHPRNRTQAAARGALILALIGFVNDVAKGVMVT